MTLEEDSREKDKRETTRRETTRRESARGDTTRRETAKRTQRATIKRTHRMTGRTTRRRRPPTKRYLFFIALLVIFTLSYLIFRGWIYGRVVQRLAQESLDHLFSAEVARVGSVRVDGQGDLHLYDVRLVRRDREEERTCFTAKEAVFSFDADPLLEDGAHIQRVDLHGAALFVQRHVDGDWNVLHLFQPATPPEEDEEDEVREYRPVSLTNGIHIYRGTLHVALRRENGGEVHWKAEKVDGRIWWDDEGAMRFDPFSGVFYDGKIEAYAKKPRGEQFVMDLLVTVREADVALMADGLPYLDRPVSGRLRRAVVSLEHDEKREAGPILAGFMEISEGNLWEFPALLGVLNVLSLDPLADRSIAGGEVRFTYRDGKVDLEQIDLRGSPLNLYGRGWIDLDGQKLEVVFLPAMSGGFRRIPVLGEPVQALLDIFLGQVVPVTVTGSWGDAKAEVERDRDVPENVKDLWEQGREEEKKKGEKDE